MLKDLTNMFNLVQNSTFIENVNNGIAPQQDYFGARTTSGMVYTKKSLYNRQNNLHADLTKEQSNYMNLREK